VVDYCLRFYFSLVIYPILYLDVDNKIAIHYIPYIDEAVLSRQQSKLKNMSLNLSEFQCRVVHDLESFVEKIQIFKGDLKHTKNPSALRHLRDRIQTSYEIYSRYIK